MDTRYADAGGGNGEFRIVPTTKHAEIAQSFWCRSQRSRRSPRLSFSFYDHGGAEVMRRILGCVVVMGWLMASGTLQAHHSLAGVYDMKAEKEISGTLTKIQFVNPH